MRCENILGVILEIKDRNEALFGDSLYLRIGSVSLLIKSHIILGSKDRVLREFVPLVSLLPVVVPEHLGEVVCA